jgi:hypothetical protein
MFQIVTVMRARRATVHVLDPFFSRSLQRVREMRDDVEPVQSIVWLSPYLVGYCATVITVVAKREIGSIGEDALGAVQAQAWGALTGLDSALFGDELAAMSLSPSAGFVSGCNNGFAFCAVLYPGGEGDALRTEAVTGGPFEVWERFVDPHL